jgi:hypothetical protein
MHRRAVQGLLREIADADTGLGVTDPLRSGLPARLVARKVNGSAEDAVKRHAEAEILPYAA